MKKPKKQIFIFNEYYDPAFKAGGPIKSLKLLNEKLSKKYSVKIFTSSYDIDMTKTTSPNDKKNNIKRFKNSFDLMNFMIGNFIFKKLYTNLYFNSFFNLRYTILPLIFFNFFVKKTKIIIAPRGELFESEIKKKKIKKILYILFFKIFLKKEKIFHVTSLEEKSAIKKIFPYNKIEFLPNLINNQIKIKDFKIYPFDKRAKFIYFSRISIKKNLLETIKILDKSKLSIDLDIYGPIEDLEYWHKIKYTSQNIQKYNNKLKINYKGSIKYNKYKILNRYNFFILLSDSENFGHVIFEAIQSKCIPIITKNSSWAQLQTLGCGLLLKKNDRFAPIKIKNFIFKVRKKPKVVENKLEQIIKNNYFKQYKINYKELFDN
jgi:hypothetical protein